MKLIRLSKNYDGRAEKSRWQTTPRRGLARQDKYRNRANKTSRDSRRGEFQDGMNQLYGIDSVFGVRYTQKKLSFAPTF